MLPFSAGFDFLDLRIIEDSDFLRSIKNLVPNSDTINFGDFHISLAFVTEKKRIYWIYDRFNIKIASISQSQRLTFIQFVGHFFAIHFDSLPFFLELLCIDPSKKKRVRRFDFRWDFHYPISYFKARKKSHNYYQSSFDSLGVDSGEKIITSTRVDSLTHEVSLYDKKIDILRTQKYKWDIPNSPYKAIISEKQPISRIEIRFFPRSVGRLENDSIDYILSRGETLAYNYMRRFYDISFDFDRVKRQNFEDTRFDVINNKKLALYKNMAYSYCDNIRLLSSEKELFKYLFRTFPNFANYALTIQDISDF